MRGHEDGISLIEILVSVFLISIAILPMLELYPNTLGINRESEYDLLLSAAAVRKTEEIINLHRAATGSVKLYLHQEVSALAGNWLAKAGTPEVAVNSTSRKGAFAQPAGTFVLLMPGAVNSSTGTPGATPAGFGWWSDVPMTRTFSAGTWSFSARRSAEVSDANSTARFYVSVFRVPQNTSTTGAVLLFTTTSPSFHYSSTAATTTWTTAAVGPFTLTNEYLLAEVWWEAVTDSAAILARIIVEGSGLSEANRSKFITTAGGTLPTSGSAPCTDLPNCLLVWTIATQLSSETSGVGRLDTLSTVACQDANGNSACDAAERQARYDAKITTRP